VKNKIKIKNVFVKIVQFNLISSSLSTSISSLPSIINDFVIRPAMVRFFITLDELSSILGIAVSHKLVSEIRIVVVVEFLSQT